MTKVYIFPGQGAQRKGMGAELFAEFPSLVEEADAALGYSIEQLCLNDAARLNQTEFTQPALYVVNALAYLKKVRQTGAEPAFVAGHSLGEYNALFAAHAFDFATGLKLVKKRGELMTQARSGGMAAVIGMPAPAVERVIRDYGLASIDIANLNAPSQTVISGPRDDIRAAERAFTGAGAAAYVPLNVSGAFHSRYMADIRTQFRRFLQGFSFQPLRIPVISNWTARPHTDAALAENLANQITGTVRWVDTMRYLGSIPGAAIEEIGPGGILTNLLKQFQASAAAPPPLPLQQRVVPACAPSRP